MNYVQPWPLTEALNPDQDIFEQISRVFNLIAFRRKVYDDTPGAIKLYGVPWIMI